MRLFSQWLGWITTITFAFSFLPQMIKTYKTKQVEDVSLNMWVPLLIGYTSGIGYSLILNERPLMFGYAWGWLCCVLFLAMYFKYKR